MNTINDAGARGGSSIEDVLRPIARYWWLWALFGVLSVIAGVIALANPGLSLLTIALLFGCYLIVAGFFDVLAGLTADDADAARRVFAVLLGVLALIAGVIVLVRPGTGLLALVLVVGVYLIVAGVLELASAFSDPQPWLGALLGLLNIVLGIVILAIPRLSLVTFAVLFGIGLIVRGAVAIAEGIRLRRLRAPEATRARPSSTAHPTGS
jgi:uncharacterized membrane protein HdeD (DUF308 family)